MLWKERQKKVEELTYHSLDLLAEEMGVTPSFYPEVYWVGRKLKFESLGLPYRYREEFNVPRRRGSIYLIKPKIILIGEDALEDIGEEAGHFLHFINSGIYLPKIYDANDFCLTVITEMFGFFCSKLITPSRKNESRKDKDPLSNLPESKKIIRKKIASLSGLDNKYIFSSEVYHQGYNLGEELFKEYLSGTVSKQKIRRLFANPLTKKDEPLTSFIGLKYNMVQFMKES